MNIDISQVTLLRTETGVPIEGELWDKVTEQQLSDWETLWLPALASGMKRQQQVRAHSPNWPQSSAWNWREKIEAVRGALAFPSFCLMCEGQTQGLMILKTCDQRCRIESQQNKDLVYVELLEVAPWNRKEFNRPPRYSGIGSLLIGAAIQLSHEEGFKGRLGLHSLPLANGFYANKCGMTDLGIDGDKESLRYFEMTSEQAAVFLEKGNQP